MVFPPTPLVSGPLSRTSLALSLSHVFCTTMITPFPLYIEKGFQQLLGSSQHLRPLLHQRKLAHRLCRTGGFKYRKYFFSSFYGKLICSTFSVRRGWQHLSLRAKAQGQEEEGPRKREEEQAHEYVRAGANKVEWHTSKNASVFTEIFFPKGAGSHHGAAIRRGE